jgi:hypothetical protein
MKPTLFEFINKKPTNPERIKLFLSFLPSYYKRSIRAVKLQGVAALLRPSEWMPCQQILSKPYEQWYLPGRTLKWSLVYMLNKAILYIPNILQHAMRRNMSSNAYSISYCCSMISRVVWMNLDTQDTCNIKQIPSWDWHIRYMQHKTSSIPSMFHLTHTYITVQ